MYNCTDRESKQYCWDIPNDHCPNNETCATRIDWWKHSGLWGVFRHKEVPEFRKSAQRHERYMLDLATKMKFFEKQSQLLKGVERYVKEMIFESDAVPWATPGMITTKLFGWEKEKHDKCHGCFLKIENIDTPLSKVTVETFAVHTRHIAGLAYKPTMRQRELLSSKNKLNKGNDWQVLLIKETRRIRVCLDLRLIYPSDRFCEFEMEPRACFNFSLSEAKYWH